MAAIENFVLRIKVEGQAAVDGLKKSVTDLGTTIGGFGANAGRMTSAISGIIGGLGGMATIAGTAATAFVGLGLRAIALADDLSDISDATGISAGALNNFKNSLVDAGGKAEDFSTLATKLNQTVGDAAVGSEKAQKAFQKLGVYVTDAGGNVRNTGDILRDAIAKLAAIEDPATRAAMAVDIFGKTANKLDFTKLNAANDPFKDEQIAQLAKYQAAIDKVAQSVNNSLLESFGKLSIAINKAVSEAEKAEKDANARGRTYGSISERMAAGLGGFGAVSNQPVLQPGGREMTDAEKAAKAKREYEATQSLLMRNYKSRAETGGGGTYGATPEATLKAAAESEKRLRQSNIEAAKNQALQGANELQAIEVNAAAEIAKARETIFAQERLSNAQKSAEFAAKKAEIETKAANDIAKVRSQLNAKIFTEEEAQRQKIAEELAAEEKRINDIVAASAKIVDEIATQNAEMAAKAKFALDAATMTDTERANAQALFDIEQQRLALLKQIADIKDLPYEERLAKEKEVNDLLNKRKEDAIANQQAQQTQREDFTAGWDKAYRQYVENSRNSFEQAGNMFNMVSRGFEDSIVRFVQTGKLSFKDLANSLIAEFVRIQAKNMFMSLFGGGGGGGGGGLLGGLFGGIGKIFGFANGGNPPVNRPSLVGERGPELFVPRTAGTIVPNGEFGGQTVNTSVTYQIHAVDAASFKTLLARDPEYLYQVTQAGRRNLPIGSSR
jgi:lambda family phage tail tape measure protein